MPQTSVLLINQRHMHLRLSQFLGFTFIEIMLVVVIVGLLASGIIMMSSRDDAHRIVATEVQSLRLLIQQAQMQAMSDHHLYGLRLHKSGWILKRFESEADILTWDVAPAVSPESQSSTLSTPLAAPAPAQWVQVEPEMSAHEIDEALSMALFLGRNDKAVDLDSGKAIPHLLFMSDGFVTPGLLLFKIKSTEETFLFEILPGGQLKEGQVDELSESRLYFN